MSPSSPAPLAWTQLTRANINIIQYCTEPHYGIVEFAYHPATTPFEGRSSTRWARSFCDLTGLPPLPDSSTIQYIQGAVRASRVELEDGRH